MSVLTKIASPLPSSAFIAPAARSSIDLGHDHLRALGEEPLGVREADALPGAGDDRDLVLETSHARVLLLLQTGDEIEALGHDRLALLGPAGAASDHTVSMTTNVMCAVSVSFS